MKRVWSLIRYGSLGVMASGIFVAIQGCDYKEIALSLLTMIALLLASTGGGGADYIEVTKVQTTVGVGQVFVSETITFKAVVADPETVDRFNWNFGDGGTGSGQTVSHSFTSAGTFTISVTINRKGDTQTLTTQLQIGSLQGPATLTVNGSGSGSIVGGTNAINCTLTNGTPSGTCSDSVSLSSTQTLTATPSGGFVFDAWTNCGSPAGAVCAHAVAGDVTISASFVETFLLTVDSGVGFPAGVRIFSTDGNIDCPGTCSFTYTSGDVVELTAVPGAFTFDEWMGRTAGVDIPCVGSNASSTSSDNPLTITMDRERYCIASIFL